MNRNPIRHAGLTTLLAGTLLLGGGYVYAQSTPESTPTSPTTTQTTATTQRSAERGNEQQGQHGERQGRSERGPRAMIDMTDMLPNATATPADAMSTAQAEVPTGDVQGISLEVQNGSLTWQVRVGNELVSIDASDGSVLGTASLISESDEDANATTSSSVTATSSTTSAPSVVSESTSDATSSLRDRAALIESATVSPAAAAQSAENAASGTASAMQFTMRSGTPTYLVLVGDQVVSVDASTGEATLNTDMAPQSDESDRGTNQNASETNNGAPATPSSTPTN